MQTLIVNYIIKNDFMPPFPHQHGKYLNNEMHLSKQLNIMMQRTANENAALSTPC